MRGLLATLVFGGVLPYRGVYRCLSIRPRLPSRTPLPLPLPPPHLHFLSPCATLRVFTVAVSSAEVDLKPFQIIPDRMILMTEIYTCTPRRNQLRKRDSHHLNDRPTNSLEKGPLRCRSPRRPQEKFGVPQLCRIRLRYSTHPEPRTWFCIGKCDAECQERFRSRSTCRWRRYSPGLV